MENKKTKLTISGNPKKSFNNPSSSEPKGKKTVLIPNKPSKKFTKSNFNKVNNHKQTPGSFKKNLSFKPNFTASTVSDFEKRKLAEQRATKKFKGEIEKDKKNKLGTKKRDFKLTVSRALSDEIETRERSLASVRRARQKELKNTLKDENKENLKPIKRDVNIPEAITVENLQIEWLNNQVM